MNTRPRIFSGSIAAALALLACASPAQPQSVDGPAILASAERTASFDVLFPSDPVPPARLEQEAWALLSGGREGWDKAAVRFLDAAELRPFGDDVAINNLLVAAHLRYHLGNRRNALRLMEEAADEAVAAGRIVTAGDAYIDAASIAAEMGLIDAATSLVDRAILLAASPHMEEEARVALLARVSGWVSAMP